MLQCSTLLLFVMFALLHIPAVSLATPALTARGVSAAEIDIAWTDEYSNEFGFIVDRSTDNQNFYYVTTVEANSRWYVNSSGLTPNTAYYYRVRALLPDAYGPYSNVAMAATEAGVTSQVVPPWQNDDIGPQHGLGNVQISNGAFTVTGHGSYRCDIYGAADDFHYVYQSWSGDGEIIALVANLVDTQNPADSWAKSGVMFRQSLAPGAPNAFTLLTVQHGAAFQSRVSPGADTTYLTGPAGQNWLRLVRSNDVFTSYVSTDRKNWLQLGSQTIAMTDPILVGLAVTPHNESYNTTLFTDVMVGIADPPAITLSSRQADGAMKLMVSGEIGRTYAIETSTDLSTWTAVTNQVNTTGAILINDPMHGNDARRFYRAAIIK